jgi:DNA-binding MarR family transcriptional regulator
VMYSMQITVTSHLASSAEDFLLFDPILVIAASLLFITLAAFILYYRRIQSVYEEYERAKSLVSDVVISVNKDLQRQGEKIVSVSGKAETLLSENQRILSKLKENDGRFAKLESDITSFSEMEPKLSTQIKEVDKRVEVIVTAQKKIEQQIAESEKMRRSRIATQAEAKIEAAIPIRREKALAPLTPTELGVLEVLANEGKKTAPEIRSKTNLTREHTARLMKKLYEDGYLERDTGKIPFAYSLKEEMRKILRKTGAETS